MRLIKNVLKRKQTRPATSLGLKKLIASNFEGIEDRQSKDGYRLCLGAYKIQSEVHFHSTSFVSFVTVSTLSLRLTID